MCRLPSDIGAPISKLKNPSTSRLVLGASKGWFIRSQESPQPASVAPRQSERRFRAPPTPRSSVPPPPKTHRSTPRPCASAPASVTLPPLPFLTCVLRNLTVPRTPTSMRSRTHTFANRLNPWPVNILTPAARANPKSPPISTSRPRSCAPWATSPSHAMLLTNSKRFTNRSAL